MLTLLTLSRAFFVFAVALIAYSLTDRPISAVPIEPLVRSHPSPTELEEIGDAEAHGVVVCIVTSTYALCE